MPNYLTETMTAWVNMLKASSSLVTLLGNSNRVYRHALPPIPEAKKTYSKADLLAFRPFCIAFRETHKFRSDSAGSGFSMQQSGRLVAMIEWPVLEADARKTGELFDAADLVLDGILSDLHAMNAQPTRLALQNIEADGPGRTPPENRASEGDFFRAHITADWGFSN